MTNYFGNIPSRQHGQATPIVFKLRQEERFGLDVVEANVGLSVINFDLTTGPVTNEPNGDLVPTFPFVEVASAIGPRGGINGSYKTLRKPFHQMLVQGYCGELDQLPDALDRLISQEERNITFAGNVMVMSALEQLSERSKKEPKARAFNVLLLAALSHLWTPEEL